MTQRRSFIRKIVYFAIIAVLLVPLSWLSRPSTVGTRRGEGNAGGYLAQVRRADDLSMASLGEVDPGSEAMKISTLGLRGVAVLMLWSEATEAKKKEDWTRFDATLRQLTKLQPQFSSVWSYQAWNTAYNVSADFDDYRDRYYYVVKGIRLLIEGTTFNKNDPGLLQEVAMTFGDKIGRSDERQQYRRLLADDAQLHDLLREQGIPIERTLGPDGKPDNWLIARQWYLRAENLVDSDPKIQVRRIAPVLFYGDAPKMQINFAEAVEGDGHFGDYAARQWREAEKLWVDYGNREVKMFDGQLRRLNDLDALEQQRDAQWKALDTLAPNVRQQLRDARLATLPADVRAAIQIPFGERDVQQLDLADRGNAIIRVAPHEVADRAPESQREAAKVVADKIRELDNSVRSVENALDTTNYRYWLQRTKIEQAPEVIAAREKLYQANEQYAAGRLDSADPAQPGAKGLFEESFALYAKALEKFPQFAGDDITGDDFIKAAELYRRRVLDGQRLPSDFVLADLLRKTNEAENLEEPKTGDDTSSPEPPPQEDGKTQKTGKEMPND